MRWAILLLGVTCAGAQAFLSPPLTRMPVDDGKGCLAFMFGFGRAANFELESKDHEKLLAGYKSFPTLNASATFGKASFAYGFQLYWNNYNFYETTIENIKLTSYDLFLAFRITGSERLSLNSYVGVGWGWPDMRRGDEFIDGGATYNLGLFLDWKITDRVSVSPYLKFAGIGNSAAVAAAILEDIIIFVLELITLFFADEENWVDDVQASNLYAHATGNFGIGTTAFGVSVSYAASPKFRVLISTAVEAQSMYIIRNRTEFVGSDWGWSLSIGFEYSF